MTALQWHYEDPHQTLDPEGEDDLDEIDRSDELEAHLEAVIDLATD